MVATLGLGRYPDMQYRLYYSLQLSTLQAVQENDVTYHLPVSILGARHHHFPTMVTAITDYARMGSELFAMQKCACAATPARIPKTDNEPQV